MAQTPPGWYPFLHLYTLDTLMRLSLLRMTVLFSFLILGGCSSSDGTEQENDGTSTLDAGADVGGNNGGLDAGNTTTDMGSTDDVGAAVDADDPNDTGDASDTGDAVDAGTELTFARFCQSLTDEWSEYTNRCYSQGFYDQDRKDQIVQPCLRKADWVAMGGLSFDPDAAQTCLDNIAASACERRELDLQFPECQDVISGQQATGESCVNHQGWLVNLSPCADGWCSNQTCPGACEPWRQEGEPCSQVDVGTCGPGLRCSTVTKLCVPIPQVGDECQFTCEDGVACVPSDGTYRCAVIPYFGACEPDEDDLCYGESYCVDGTCQWQVARGDRCRSNTNCPAGDVCFDSDGFNNGELGVCTIPLAENATCYNALQSACADGLDCVPDGGRRSCQVSAAVGEPCKEWRCAAGAWCDVDAGANGTCRAVGDLGDPCARANRPETCRNDLVCVDQICREPGEVGDPCDLSWNPTCVEGLFCSRETATCVPPAGLDQPCNPRWESTCSDGLGCDCPTDDESCSDFNVTNPQDVCKPALAVGDVCFRDSECASHTCRDSNNDDVETCQPALCFGPI